MLINGQQAGASTEEILGQLTLIPSSFPDYLYNTRPLIAGNQELYSKALQLCGEASRQLDVKSAIKQFEIVVEIPEIQFDKATISHVNLSMARGYQVLGKVDEAKKRFQNAAQYSIAAGKYYEAEHYYKELAALHQQTGTIQSYQQELEGDLAKSQSKGTEEQELDVRLALGAALRVQGRHDEAIEQYSAAYSLQQGKVDYKAYRVEQREVGFSNQAKIGTDNIQQCVVVIVYDPETKKTALAHVDRYTDPSSLSKDVLDKFPVPSSDKKLEVYLVGGRDRSSQSLAVSDANIKKITEELNKHAHVDIKAADVGDKGAPSGIVFDPITGKLEHAVPGKEDRSAKLRQVRVNLIDGIDNGSQLNFAFDLTKSKDIQPPILSAEQKKQCVRRFYYTGPQIAPNNTTETWQANQLSSPISKVVEEIRGSDPELVKNTLSEIMVANVDALNLDDNKKQALKNNMISSTAALLADTTMPMSIICTKLNGTLAQNAQLQTVSDPSTLAQNTQPKTVVGRIERFQINLNRAVDTVINKVSTLFKRGQGQVKEMVPNVVNKKIEDRRSSSNSNKISPPPATPSTPIQKHQRDHNRR
jgi:tetratricopeptide (TPR) repeat protein